MATENGLRFNIDWLRGQKTGFFVDQRDNRALLQRYSGGRRVLNMFCYTGGFSVYAMRGDAELVHSVDSSEKAVTLTDANIELNFPGDGRHKSFAVDAFKFLRICELPRAFVLPIFVSLSRLGRRAVGTRRLTSSTSATRPVVPCPLNLAA